MKWRSSTDKLERMVQRLLQEVKAMSAQLDALTAEVARNTEVDQSAITLLEGLKAKLDEAGTDPAKLQALSDSLGADTQRLADAVVANTPAEEGE